MDTRLEVFLIGQRSAQFAPDTLRTMAAPSMDLNTLQELQDMCTIVGQPQTQPQCLGFCHDWGVKYSLGHKDPPAWQLECGCPATLVAAQKETPAVVLQTRKDRVKDTSLFACFGSLGPNLQLLLRCSNFSFAWYARGLAVETEINYVV